MKTMLRLTLFLCIATLAMAFRSRARTPAPAFIGPMVPGSPIDASPQQKCLPVGASYKQTLSFPVLGKQAFEIEVLSEDSARLVISGMMSVDEVIGYEIDQRGKLLFDLSTKTQQILKRFKTKLLEAGYDRETDTPYVKVAPYVLPAVKIRMSRHAQASPSAAY